MIWGEPGDLRSEARFVGRGNLIDQIKGSGVPLKVQTMNASDAMMMHHLAVRETAGSTNRAESS